MIPAIAEPDAVERLLREAVEWRIVSLVLQRPRSGWKEELEELSGQLEEPTLLRAVEGVSEATEGAYLRLFGPGGTVSPREVGHRPLADPGRILASLAALYEAFAYQTSLEDPPDHVAVESDFAAYLKVKEAFARARRDEEAASVTSRAFDRFLSEHLAPLALGICGRLDDAAPKYLAAAAKRLEQRITSHGSNVGALGGRGPAADLDGSADASCRWCEQDARG